MLNWVVCYKTATRKTVVNVVFCSLGQVIVQMVVARDPLTVGAEVHRLSIPPIAIVVEVGHGNDAFLHRLAAQSAFEIDLNGLLTLFGIVFSHVGLLWVDYMTKYT